MGCGDFSKPASEVEVHSLSDQPEAWAWDPRDLDAVIRDAEGGMHNIFVNRSVQALVLNLHQTVHKGVPPEDPFRDVIVASLMLRTPDASSRDLQWFTERRHLIHSLVPAFQNAHQPKRSQPEKRSAGSSSPLADIVPVPRDTPERMNELLAGWLLCHFANSLEHLRAEIKQFGSTGSSAATPSTDAAGGVAGAAVGTQSTASQARSTRRTVDDKKYWIRVLRIQNCWANIAHVALRVPLPPKHRPCSDDADKPLLVQPLLHTIIQAHHTLPPQVTQRVSRRLRTVSIERECEARDESPLAAAAATAASGASNGNADDDSRPMSLFDWALASGADPRACDSAGRTALHLEAEALRAHAAAAVHADHAPVIPMTWPPAAYQVDAPAPLTPTSLDAFTINSHLGSLSPAGSMFDVVHSVATGVQHFRALMRHGGDARRPCLGTAGGTTPVAILHEALELLLSIRPAVPAVAVQPLKELLNDIDSSWAEQDQKLVLAPRSCAVPHWSVALLHMHWATAQLAAVPLGPKRRAAYARLARKCPYALAAARCIAYEDLSSLQASFRKQRESGASASDHESGQPSASAWKLVAQLGPEDTLVYVSFAWEDCRDAASLRAPLEACRRIAQLVVHRLQRPLERVHFCPGPLGPEHVTEHGKQAIPMLVMLCETFAVIESPDHWRHAWRLSELRLWQSLGRASAPIAIARPIRDAAPSAEPCCVDWAPADANAAPTGEVAAAAAALQAPAVAWLKDEADREAVMLTMALVTPPDAAAEQALQRVVAANSPPDLSKGRASSRMMSKRTSRARTSELSSFAHESSVVAALANELPAHLSEPLFGVTLGSAAAHASCGAVRGDGGDALPCGAKQFDRNSSPFYDW